MRFMFIVRTDSKAGPTPALMTAMHELAQREVAAGRMVADGGLKPKDQGAEISLKQGKITVTDGPFAETKEVIGGFAIFELPSREAALASAREFLELHAKHAPGWEGVLEMRELGGSQVELLRGGAPA